MKNSVNDNIKLPIHYTLILSDADVRTIDYLESIERTRAIFNINEIQYQDLKEIGKIRNKIAHFGINRAIEYHEIIGIINRILDFILEFHYPLLGDKNGNPLDQFYDKILDIIEIGELAEEECWAAFFSANFEILNNLLKQVNSDSELKTFLMEKGFDLRLSIGQYIDSSSFRIDLIGSEGKGFELIYTVNIPRLNITALAGESSAGPIYAIIDHLENYKPLYVYKQPLLLDDYEASFKKFWKKDKRCFRT